MVKPDRAPVALTPEVRDGLNGLVRALRREYGRAASQSEVIGALLQGTPLWQADLMVAAYLRSTAGESDPGT